MDMELRRALAAVEDVAALVFEREPRTRSVGVGRVGAGYGYVATRNVEASVPLSARRDLVGRDLPQRFHDVPIVYRDSSADPTSLAKVRYQAPGRTGAGHPLPEQCCQANLSCGLEIQNFDDDSRQNLVAAGIMNVGSLGCFVRTASDELALLSNSHVVAGENRGVSGHDRILHAGATAFSSARHIGTLGSYEPLVPSPHGASVLAGNVVYNEVDAGLAVLDSGRKVTQAYLAGRHAKPPGATAPVQLSDRVHKVGRTTGLTYGQVTQIGAVVDAVGYDVGPCWFRDSFVIEGMDHQTFADGGDSGSAIVRTHDGAILGLLYAGLAGTLTYACPIEAVFRRLNCRLS